MAKLICNDCGAIILQPDKQECCSNCGSLDWIPEGIKDNQDEDTLEQRLSDGFIDNEEI